MAKELFRSGNYLICIDGNGYQREFPVSKTVYSERENAFLITEGQIQGQEILIDISDSPNWKNDNGVSFTEASFRTFLRENTDFNPASGGSGASSKLVLISRANNTENIEPTVTEFPTPKEGSTSIVSLNGKRNEYWEFIGGIWVNKFYSESSPPIREFDSIDEVDNLTFVDGERIITKSSDPYGVESDYTQWIFKLAAPSGDYEISNLVTGYFDRDNDEVSWFTVRQDDGANNDNIDLNSINKGQGNIDAPNSEIVRIRRHANSTMTLITDLGLTIANDDFDWHEFRRLPNNDFEHVGKPFSSSFSQNTVTHTVPANDTVLTTIPYPSYIRGSSQSLDPVAPIVPVGTIDVDNKSGNEQNLIDNLNTSITYNDAVYGTVNQSQSGIDIGFPQPVLSLNITWFNNTYAANNATIQGSVDGVTWVDLVTNINSLNASQSVAVPYNINSSLYRYYRLFSVLGYAGNYVVMRGMVAIKPGNIIKKDFQNDIDIDVMNENGFVRINNNKNTAIDLELFYNA